TGDPSIVVELNMHLDRYAVSPTLTAQRAWRNAATDRLTYLQAYYQLAQPNIDFSLSTTLEASPDISPVTPISHTLDPEPFRSFVTSAWIALDAISATQAAVFNANAGETIGSVATAYDVALSDVFSANGEVLYSTLFGTNSLAIPVLYTTAAGDTLDAIA